MGLVWSASQKAWVPQDPSNPQDLALAQNEQNALLNNSLNQRDFQGKLFSTPTNPFPAIKAEADSAAWVAADHAAHSGGPGGLSGFLNSAISSIASGIQATLSPITKVVENPAGSNIGDYAKTVAVIGGGAALANGATAASGGSTIVSQGSSSRTLFDILANNTALFGQQGRLAGAAGRASMGFFDLFGGGSNTVGALPLPNGAATPPIVAPQDQGGVSTAGKIGDIFAAIPSGIAGILAGLGVGSARSTGENVSGGIAAIENVLSKLPTTSPGDIFSGAYNLGQQLPTDIGNLLRKAPGAIISGASRTGADIGGFFKNGLAFPSGSGNQNPASSNSTVRRSSSPFTNALSGTGGTAAGGTGGGGGQAAGGQGGSSLGQGGTGGSSLGQGGKGGAVNVSIATPTNAGGGFDFSTLTWPLAIVGGVIALALLLRKK